ncbi:hypothetical protein HanXRQr2_Chr11g0478621 [Helianthus annuus]|uniref:Uncharacterized protein n=1 Tax=Helianthus annuus TaxID=4232 RepID=A0A9K3HMN8_HELAN|nr:hypothetical protein HanXRQr2_Chr11g0478621 [Helianthus annuus]
MNRRLNNTTTEPPPAIHRYHRRLIFIHPKLSTLSRWKCQSSYGFRNVSYFFLFF